MTVRINRVTVIIVSILLSLGAVYLTLTKPGCPPGLIFDCYGYFKQGGWPFEYLKYIGGGIALPKINYGYLFLDCLIFFVPIYIIINSIFRGKKIS